MNDRFILNYHDNGEEKKCPDYEGPYKGGYLSTMFDIGVGVQRIEKDGHISLVEETSDLCVILEMDADTGVPRRHALFMGDSINSHFYMGITNFHGDGWIVDFLEGGK